MQKREKKSKLKEYFLFFIGVIGWVGSCGIIRRRLGWWGIMPMQLYRVMPLCDCIVKKLRASFLKKFINMFAIDNSTNSKSACMPNMWVWVD